MAKFFRQIEDDGYRKAVKSACEFDERLAGFELDVCGIDNGETARGETLCSDVVKNLERVVGGGEVVFVVGNQAAAIVGGEDFRGEKVLARERGFAGAGCSD